MTMEIKNPIITVEKAKTALKPPMAIVEINIIGTKNPAVVVKLQFNLEAKIK